MEGAEEGEEMEMDVEGFGADVGRVADGGGASEAVWEDDEGKGW